MEIVGPTCETAGRQSSVVQLYGSCPGCASKGESTRRGLLAQSTGNFRRFTMAHDSGSPISQCKDRSFPNEQERAIRWRAEKTRAGGGESNEECPCAIFQVPRGVGNSAHEREDLFRLQC